MTEELKLGDTAGENAIARQTRAAAIIRRKALEQQATLQAAAIDL